ncbi:MAG: potassium transporter TrkG [Eubacteriales bacterium]|nr:potassium transporter TrkG [Eubacteriales bacterium]
MFALFRRQSSGRLIAIGFALLILLGSVILMLPWCLRNDVSLRYIDALYTSASAVCVTGLTVVDTADTFTPLGQAVVGLLIQAGGLGVATVGAGIMLAMGRRVDLKGRTVLREAMNLSGDGGVVRLLKKVLTITAAFELTGAILSFPIFAQNYPVLKAVEVSLFHSIAAFNNSGFDILGGMRNLIPYQHSLLLNLVTCGLIFFGGIGFPVMSELAEKRFRWKKLSMHTRVVLSVSSILLAAGALLIKLTEDISWLGAVFFSFSARTAGFSTYSLGGFTKSGLFVVMMLMFIGASPGSTGGGIKTTTFFAILQGIKSAATNRSEKAFHYSLPPEAFRKAVIIALMGLGIIGVGTYLLCILEPNIPFLDILFEAVSAFGTVGLSTGITPSLGTASKLLSIMIMYIGRLGPMTIATLWYFNKGEGVRYPQGNISIG